MRLRRTLLDCQRFLLNVSAQQKPNRGTGVGSFNPISTGLPDCNHGIRFLSMLSTPHWISGSFPIFMSRRIDAHKKQVKKETELGVKTEVDFEIELGLTSKKDESFGEWYSQVVVNGGLIAYSEFYGRSVVLQSTLRIWETMQKFFGAEIQKIGVRSTHIPQFVYENFFQAKDHVKGFAPENFFGAEIPKIAVKRKQFPGFVNKNFLQAKDHVEGFAPEVVCATELGHNDVEEPINKRFTNEADLYSCISNLISTHEDLPFKINRWYASFTSDDNHPDPFDRNKEFFWQEGYTAFATKEEADNEIPKILELYRIIYEEYLAIPVVKGVKSPRDKIAGGLYTTSVEAFIPNTGCGLQGATARSLGQNFAKKFGIDFVNENGDKCMVYQNFWTLGVFTIAAMVMVHGDDKGLVLPPKVAAVQIIIIPVPRKVSIVKSISAACSSTVQILRAAGFRAEHDLRDNYSPAWKHSNWEMKGVPLRIEISPEDIAKKQFRIVRRDTGSKVVVPKANLVAHVQYLIMDIQESMFNAAKVKRDACKMIVHTWEEFITALNDKKLILAPWCDEEDDELDLMAFMEDTPGAAKILCYPFDQPSLPKGTLCFASGKPAKKWAYWCRAYY